MTLKHRFQSPKADNLDPTRLGPEDWGSTTTDYAATSTHVFSGGVSGDVLVRDTTAVDGTAWTSSLGRLTLTDKLLIGASPAFGPADEAIGLSYGGVIYSRTITDDSNRALISLAPIQNIPGGTSHGNAGVMLGDTFCEAVCPGDDTTTLLGDRLLRWSGLHTGAGYLAAPGWCMWATIDPASDVNYDRLAVYNDGTFYWLVTQAGGTGVRQSLRLSAPVVAVDGRLQGSMGDPVVAANSLTLGMGGNLFHITGATQINAITTANWQAGSEVTFIFDSTPTVKHNTAGAAGTAKLLLAGSVDFSATANDTLTLRYDGTSWFEKCRAVI